MRSAKHAEHRKARRTLNACNACRQSKIKCSGDEPCTNCRRRLIKCQFTEGGNKVLVSEQYLQELKRLSQDRQQHSPNQPSPTNQSQSPHSSNRPRSVTSHPSTEPNVGSSVSVTDEVPSFQPNNSAFNIWTSPFTSPFTTIKNTHNDRRRWIWLAPWSTWSFTVRLRVMMTEKLQYDVPNSPPSYFSGNTFSLKWKPCPDDAPPDISGLPSIDHTLYLVETVKFHLGHHYRFYDNEEFVRNIHEFYSGDAQEKATRSRLWFVQFLLVLSFGQAFLSRSKDPDEPPGAKFFKRAMSLIPDMASIWKDSLLAVEILVLAGIYLYSIDQREAAHVHVGQAMRIAQMEGLHTALPEEEIGSETVARCRDLWWNLYIIDRHFSSSIGVPMSVADSDITTLMNPLNTCSQEETTINLRVKLSHLLAVTLRTIYKTEKTQLGVFLETTRSILHTLAGYAKELESTIDVKLRNSIETMSKGTRHITLLYHQCVIVATRPLLLSVLQERLEKLDHRDEERQGLWVLTRTLISTGIKSAVKTLQILSDEDNHLEVFLPFDLEFTYAAALHSIMADMIFPDEANSQNYTTMALSILDELIGKGNKVAESRKAELTHLETLCHEVTLQSEQRGLQALTLSGPQGSQIVGNNPPTSGGPSVPVPEPQTSTILAEHQQASSASFDSQTATNIEFLDNIGISSYDFQSIVDQMDDQGIFSYGMTDAEPN